MNNIEKAARALARADGVDPEDQSASYSLSQSDAVARGEIVRPVWKDYESEAARFVCVLAAFDLIPAPPE